MEFPSVARTAVGALRLANLAELLTPNGLTELGQRVVDRTAAIEDALAVGVRDCMIGQDGIEIVPLLQRGASILARTNHVWARCCPGLLPVEMEAIIYWACVASPRCLKLHILAQPDHQNTQLPSEYRKARSQRSMGMLTTCPRLTGTSWRLSGMRGA